MLFLNISNTSSKCLVFSPAKVLSSCINSGIKVNSCLHFSLFPGAADHNVSDGKGSRTSSNVLPFRSIPGPPCLPLLGSLLPYKLGIKKLDYYHEYLRGLYEKYGPVVREDLGPTTIVHIFDPMDIDKIYKSTTVPHIAPLLQTAKEYKMKKGASQGIGNTNGAEWERLRKAVNKFTLRPQFVNRYIPVQDDVAREAVSLLHKRLLKDDGSVPLLEQLLDRVVTESLHRIVLGSGLGSLDPQRQSADDLAITLAFSNKRIFEMSTHLKLSTGLYRKFPTLKSKKLWQLNDLLYGTLHELCSAAAFAKGAAAVSGDDELARDDSLMHHMMHDNALDGKDYVTIISSFLTDAYVTTVPSLLGALHLLAVSPDVQEQLRHEALSVCPRQERLTHTHVAAASKLAAFFKESLRIYPIGDSVQRLVTEDMVIKNYLLPAGTCLDLNVYIWLRDAAVFPEPERVRLERWARPPEGGVTDAFQPIMNTPFSTGVRTCVGRRLALHDMSCFILRLLQRYRISQSPVTSPRQVYRVLLRPQVLPRSLKFHPVS